MSVTEEIKSRLDIVDVVAEHVTLRKSGHSYQGFCPFHANTRTPAFVVFPDSQTWRCFGACAEGGDVFSFLMKKEGWDFKETLKTLAERAGVELEPAKPVDKEKKAVEDRLGDLIAAAADYFHQLFLYAPQAEIARNYMVKRGLTEQTLADFQIGFSLNSWDACRTHFNAQGYSDEDLLAAGLLTENEAKGTRYDRFRNRLMIPIWDVSGRLVGFGARTLEKDGLPKYLNSPQSVLFDKSSLLYGLNKAKRHIREARQVVIVEGYTDVMQAHQAGFGNVVAQMGTALTGEQLRLLKRYTKRFILALDADAAGANATLRGLQVARETLDKEYEVHFDSRGLVHHEGRLQADIRVVTMPEGEDPDSIIHQDSAAWPKLLSKAEPIVAYVIRVVTQELDMNDPKAKAAAAEQILPLIQDIQSPVERDHYRQLLARTLGVDERSLAQIAVVPAQRPLPPPPPAFEENHPNGHQPTKTKPKPITGNHILRMEANYLRQMMRFPQLMRQVDQKLIDCEQPIVREDDFSVLEDQAILVHLRQHANRGTVVITSELWDSLDATLQNRVQSLLTLPDTPESELRRLPDTLVLSVLGWRLEKLKKLNLDVKRLSQNAREQKEFDLLETYTKQVRTLSQQIRSLNRAKHAMSAMSRREAE